MLLCALGLWFTAIIPGIDRWSKRFFMKYFSIFMLCCLLGIGDIFFYASFSTSAYSYYLYLILECLILSLPMPMLTVYLLHCCGENTRRNRLMQAVSALWAVYFLILISAVFIKGFSSYTPDNSQWIRGPLYPLFLVPLVAILLLNLAGAIRRRKQLSRKTFFSFLVALLPITVALIIQMFLDVFPLIDISYVVSALAMYGFALSDQIEQDRRRQREIARQQQEIAHQRASIMVLQMRPHFIYNTMTSIYCLCDQDPPLARQVIMDFTTYLRRNFTAIASAAPIPFSSELEHTRAYLAVEHALYEDSLFVEYDTPHTWFRIPPLTLQPIVENAVKHGRDPYAGPFRIFIRTRKTDSGSEITVTDNGRGYQPADDGEPHIALQNIQERLELMCGGHLTILPGDNGGTVVTVTIPDRAEEKSSASGFDILETPLDNHGTGSV